MLSQQLADYVDFQRALGYKYRVEATLLRSFARFAEARGDRFIANAAVLSWANEAPSLAQKHNRLMTVRRFATAAHAQDSRHEVPAADAFGRITRQRRSPYIFSRNDLSHLLEAAAQLKPHDSLRPHTYHTLFGLLASTGLRISEALALTLDDLAEDGVVIRATKFRKDRLVPLHPSVRDVLEHYVVRCQRVTAMPPALFIASQGTALCYSTVNATFLALVRAIGLHPGPGCRGPTLHDLRHTFAVHSLEQCAGNAQAVSRHMSALSTYLGHAHVSDTYWYLQATPTLMRQIATDTEARHLEVAS